MKACTKLLASAFMFTALALTGCSAGIEKFSQDELVSNLNESSKESVFEAVLAGKNAENLLLKLSDEQKAAIFDDMLANKDGEELLAKLSNEQKASIFDKMLTGKNADELLAKLSNEQKASIFDKMVEDKRTNETLLSILTEEEIFSIKASELTADEKAVIFDEVFAGKRAADKVTELLNNEEKAAVFDEVFADKRAADKVTELLNDAEKAAVFDSLVYSKLTKDIIINFILKSENETIYNEVKKEITDKLTKEELVTLLDATDTTAPEEVTNLTVIQKTNAITLAWNDGADTDNDLFGYLVSWQKTSAARAITALEKDTILVAKNTDSKGTNKVTLTNLAIGTNYTVTVQAVDLIGNKSTGVSTDVTPERIPDGFVKTPGVTINGTETWKPYSSVFVSERQLTIPSLIVCDHEVTRGEYKTIMGKGPTTSRAYDMDGNQLLTETAVLDNPVYNENWYAAITYCNKLSIEKGLTPCYSVAGVTDWKKLAYSSIPTSSNSTWNAATCNFEANGYRLPTEAEWEWLARGGENYEYAGSDIVDDVAWHYDIKPAEGTRYVKTKQANGYDLYDMSGNIGEWCWDWYAESIISSTAASGADTGTKRVNRGGSYYDSSFAVSVNKGRNSLQPYIFPYYVGFRVVRTSK